MCLLLFSLGFLLTFVVTCPGATYASPIFNLYIVAHEGLDHTQVTYRTSSCLVHYYRDEPLLAISSALIRTPVVLFDVGHCCGVVHGCILGRHDDVANDSLALVLGVGQENSFASDRFVQGSLYPFLAHYHLREVLFPSIATVR